MSLPWIDDSRSIANADASYGYTITQDYSSQAFLPGADDAVRVCS
jgi:hypothetical protein